ASSEPPHGHNPDSTRLLVRELVALGTVAALFLGGLIFWATSGRGPKSGRAGPNPRTAKGVLTMFVGDRACRECHPGEVASHSRSGHSHPLRAAGEIELARRLDGLRMPDPEQPGVSWNYALRDGRLRVERAAGDQTTQFVIDYAFGSGQHATTPFSLTD